MPADTPGLDLIRALAVAEASASLREAAAALRIHFGARPVPLKVIVVDALDMRGETPAALGSRRALYLGASDGHCWQMTSDPARAAGIFVAERV